MRILDLACSVSLLAALSTSACGNEESVNETLASGTQDTGTGGTGGNGSGASSGAGGATACVPGTTETCYSGPAGTENIGVCKSGTRTCAEDGSAFGECVGEMVPKADNCATPADENCDGATPGCGSDNLWARRFDVAEGYALGVGSDSNPVIGGRFPGSINFGGNTLTSSGGFDAFITKLDGASGDHIWSRRLGGSEDQTIWSLAIAPDGNVVVVGEFLGQMSVGGGNTLTSAGGYDIFVAKYDGIDGEFIWAKRFGDIDDQIARGVTISKTGEVLVTGSFAGSVDFGVGTLTSAGSFDVFVLRLDENGNPLQAKRFGDNQEQNGRAITVDASGGAIFTGDFRSTMDFGAAVLTSNGNFDIFAARIDTAGNVVYANGYGNKDPQRGYSITTNPAGNAVVSGLIRGEVDLGGGILPAQNLDVFVLELSPNGQHIRSFIMGGQKADNGGGIAIGAESRILVGGGFQSDGSFGGTIHNSAGGFDAFVTRYNAAGDLLSVSAFGDSQDQTITAIATDPASRIFIAAEASGTIDFGNQSGPLGGNAAELVIAKLAP